MGEGTGVRAGYRKCLYGHDITNQSYVKVQAAGGGSIAVNARNLDVLENSKLIAGIGSGLGSVDTVARDITLNATVCGFYK